jgi:alkaline phosphatase D
MPWLHNLFFRQSLLAAAFSMMLMTSSLAAELTAGPMVGATAMRQVKIWLQANGPGKAQIEYWEVAPANTATMAMNVSPKRAMSHTVALEADTDFVAQFNVGLIEPGRTYEYRVLIDNKEQKIPQPLRFKSQSFWQWHTDAPDWKMLLGSCSFTNDPTYDRPGRPYGGAPSERRIYDSMAAQKPDLTVWNGDYLYYREADEDSELGMRYRWRYDRGQADHQSLLRTGSHVALWDDHDYGPNDSNSSFRLKGEALALFKRYWANPSFGLPELPGAFTTYRFNDAELFMLDDRYYRDSDKLQAADKSKIGAAQLRWLKNALLMSVSPIKLIVTGGQVTDDTSAYEGWHNFPEERADFLKFLADHKLNGVILLTGDRHFTQVLKTERQGLYPLYELTCSPTLSGPASGLVVERLNKKMVPGTFVQTRNFCSLDFSGPKNDRRITLRSFAVNGDKNWEREIRLTELQVPSAAKVQ